jgi:hypothetical protein
MAGSGVFTLSKYGNQLAGRIYEPKNYSERVLKYLYGHENKQASYEEIQHACTGEQPCMTILQNLAVQKKIQEV